jgi:hypothetical protein
MRLWLCQDGWHSKFRGSCTLPWALPCLRVLVGVCSVRPGQIRPGLPSPSTTYASSAIPQIIPQTPHVTLLLELSSQSQSGTNSCWRPQEKSWTTSCHFDEGGKRGRPTTARTMEDSARIRTASRQRRSYQPLCQTATLSLQAVLHGPIGLWDNDVITTSRFSFKSTASLAAGPSVRFSWEPLRASMSQLKCCSRSEAALERERLHPSESS